MTKETIKHLVFDLDGTIVFDGKTIDASLLEHILEKLDPDSIASQVPLSQKQVTKIILFGVNPDLAKLFQELIEATVLYHDLVEELVITAKGIDKYNAVKALIGEESYIAFGNDHNDITMLENAQKAICLGNLLQLTYYHSMDISELRRYLEELVSIK